LEEGFCMPLTPSILNSRYFKSGWKIYYHIWFQVAVIKRYTYLSSVSCGIPTSILASTSSKEVRAPHLLQLSSSLYYCLRSALSPSLRGTRVRAAM
jgi:hypothetical protein